MFSFQFQIGINLIAKYNHYTNQYPQSKDPCSID